MPPPCALMISPLRSYQISPGLKEEVSLAEEMERPSAEWNFFSLPFSPARHPVSKTAINIFNALNFIFLFLDPIPKPLPFVPEGSPGLPHPPVPLFEQRDATPVFPSTALYH